MDALYFLEHKLLPNQLYKEKLGFIGALLDREELLGLIAKEVAESAGEDFAYDAADFCVALHVLDEANKLYLLQFEFPEPPASPLCYRALFLFDLDFKSAAYFTVERSFGENGPFGPAGAPMLCSWNTEDCHLNHGPVGETLPDQLRGMFRVWKSRQDDLSAE